MSYNGSGTFNINTTGQPVVAGTVISSSAFNSLTNDLATGLTTAITKDGQTTTTARITFAQGLTSSLTTDSSSVSTGSIITDGGVGIAKNLYVGGTLNVTGSTALTNPVINNIKMGYSTTATAAGTTTLTVASNYRQFFTGTLAQTIVLPVTSTLVTGMAYEIENNSTGTLTVNSSGGNLVGTIPAGVCAHAVCIGTTLTTAADWDWDYISTTTITGTGANVLGTAPTIASANLTTALTLTGASGTVGQVLTSGGSGGAPTWSSPSTTSISNGTSNVTVNSSGGSITAATNGTTAITVDTSQNVGIGVTPSATSSGKAVEIGTVGNTLWGIGAADLQISAGTYYNGANKYAVTGSAVSAYELVAGSHRWYYAASGTAGNTATFSESMRIDSSGNLLLGTTSVAGTSAFDIVRPANTATYIYMLKNTQLEMTMGAKASTDTNFYIGSGSSTIGQNGVYLTSAGNSWNAVSDERQKNIIETIENGLEKVSTLRAVIGSYKHDPKEIRRPFLIAQDVQAVLPEAVNIQDEETGILGMSYTDVIPLLVASIKELKAINDTQAETINALTARIVALENA